MNFFKSFLAALLAFFVANILWFFLGLLILICAVASIGSSKIDVRPDSVLRIDLSSSIVDAPVTDPLAGLDIYSMSVSQSNTMMQVMNAIEAAADDDRIKGIYINLTGGGTASINIIEELRAEIERFKQSGKFVISYGETYSQAGYYLSSVADSVYLNPKGEMEWRGMALQVMFYKGLLDKLGVQPEIFRHGTFKSAVEPYIMTKMSPENRLQMETLANSIWGTMVESIADSRDLSIDSLNDYASQLSAITAEDVLDKRMVDGLKYEDEVEDLIREKLFLDADEDIEYISLCDYISSLGTDLGRSSKNRIEVIYADGNIVSGSSSQGVLGAATLTEQLAEARMDEKVKAVVLRVNSPGGSALASEVIWREMELLRAQKPVIVSMSSYAASGGYYISAPADVIIADKTTLTGSIGVFGLTFNIGKALSDKVGITFDVAKSNPSADMGSSVRSVTPREREVIMKSIEEVYTTFVGHVADGRNMTFDSVDAIGQGRVWSGADAKQIGLVDDFGGLREAILIAADKAEVGDDFRVSESVNAPTGLAAILGNFEARASERKIREEFGEYYDSYRSIRSLMDNQGIQAVCPYNVTIE